MSTERDIIFVNAGIQNRDYCLDEKPYKMTGILAAQVLNHLHGNPEIVHAWNTVGIFNDEAVTSPEERLEQKYSSEFMREHLDRWDGTVDILRDDNPAFGHFALECLESALSRNSRMYVAEEEFIRCSECQQTIAEKSVTIDSCPNCQNASALATTVESALFVDLPDDHLSLLPYHRQYNKVNLRHELSTLHNIPHRLLLSRDRRSGIDLDALDLPGKKLDPRLGVGLLALHTANLYGYQEAGLTQSSSTLIRTVPYLSSVIPDADAAGLPSFKYAFHGKISPELIKSSGLQPELLAFQSLCQRNEVSEKTVQSLSLQASGVARRLGQLRHSFGGHVNLGYAEIPGATDGNLTDIFAATNKALGRAVELSKNKDNEQAPIVKAMHYGGMLSGISGIQ